MEIVIKITDYQQGIIKEIGNKKWSDVTPDEAHRWDGLVNYYGSKVLRLVREESASKLVKAEGGEAS